jgi:hypothetical protein
MAVTLNNEDGSVVAQAGQQIDVASLLDLTATVDPTYLVVSLLDRDEYTASSNGNTGTLSGNGHTIGFSNIGSDSDTVGIVFTYNAATGQYTNPIYGNLANLVYTASTNTNDNTCVSFFTTNNASLANEYANNPYALESYAPTSTYVGSISVVTQPAFAGTTPTQATPNSIEAAALSFVGKAWNMDGCWVLASNISAIAGASLPITSTSLGIPGVASGEWIVAYNGPAGQTGNWQANITAGEMVVFETSSTSGHITTVVSGSGGSAMLVDNITYVNQNGQIVNSANDGSANDVIIAAPHPASQEWAMAVAGSVVVYELDCPVITVATAVSTDSAGKAAALAPLFSASNPLASQAITKYQFYDVGTGGAASDSFMVGGSDEVGHSVANAITVNASALSTVDLLAGSSSGMDTVEVRAFNGSYWGDWVSMNVNIGPADISNKPIAVSLSHTIDLTGDALSVAELYAGYFNRSPDATGLSFWLAALNSGVSVSAIADDFAYSKEAISLYPSLSTALSATSASSLVNSVYDNFLDRPPDSAGLSYWMNELEAGTVKPGSFILAIESSVSQQSGTADALTLVSKATAGTADTTVVAQTGSASVVSSPTTIITGAMPGDTIVTHDASMLNVTALTAAQLSSISALATLPGAISVASAFTAGPHGIDAFQWGGNTYIVENAAAGIAAATSSVVELIGVHSITASATVGGFTLLS